MPGMTDAAVRKMVACSTEKEKSCETVRDRMHFGAMRYRVGGTESEEKYQLPRNQHSNNISDAVYPAQKPTLVTS